MGDLSGPPESTPAYLVEQEVSRGVSRQLTVRFVEAAEPTDDPWAWVQDRVTRLARVQHPALEPIHHVTRYDDRPVVISDHVPSMPLSALSGPVPPRAIAEIGAAVASLLHFLSRRGGGPGLVHGALHRGCVRVTPAGAVRVMGLVGAQPSGENIPPLSPELMAGEAATDASDRYTLCAILAELAIGEPLFDHIQMNTLLSGTLEQERFERRLAERLARLPEALCDALVPYMAFDPGARPPARGLLEQLEIVAGQLEGPSLRTWAMDTVTVPTETAPGPLSGQTVTVRSSAVGVEPVAPFHGLAANLDTDTPIDHSREEQPTVLASGSQLRSDTPISDVRTTFMPGGSGSADIEASLDVTDDPNGRPPQESSQPSLNVPQGPLPEPTQIRAEPEADSSRQLMIAAGVLVTVSVLLLAAAAILVLN